MVDLVKEGSYFKESSYPWLRSTITSKLTSKAQTTIPQPVRAALHLREGDELRYELDGERVILTKAKRDGVVDDPFCAFYEWHSEADQQAYGDL